MRGKAMWRFHVEQALRRVVRWLRRISVVDVHVGEEDFARYWTVRVMLLESGVEAFLGGKFGWGCRVALSIPGYRTWVPGVFDTDVERWIGALVRGWHRSSRGAPDLTADFDIQHAINQRIANPPVQFRWTPEELAELKRLGVRPLPRMPVEYDCPCGARFPESLGKYGCPNCEGDHTAALQPAVPTDPHQQRMALERRKNQRVAELVNHIAATPNATFRGNT